jgi:hypothetical protein
VIEYFWRWVRRCSTRWQFKNHLSLCLIQRRITALVEIFIRAKDPDEEFGRWIIRDSNKILDDDFHSCFEFYVLSSLECSLNNDFKFSKKHWFNKKKPINKPKQLLWNANSMKSVVLYVLLIVSFFQIEGRFHSTSVVWNFVSFKRFASTRIMLEKHW